MLNVYSPLFDLLSSDESPMTAWMQRVTQGFAPAVDIHEADGAYILSAELPGVRPEDVDLKVDKNVLTLSGTRQYSQQSDDKGYRRIERRYGNFTRSFTLPEHVDADGIQASLENGVLTISVPKGTKAQVRKIAVRGVSNAAVVTPENQG